MPPETLMPDPDRNARLLRQVVILFGACPAVRRVFAFGSFARGDADRWSDLDLLVVTGDRAQFGQVYIHLAQAMPVLYRSTFTPQCEPSGGRVLGIVFEGESVFHNLDLNFLTEEEYSTPGALDRFGSLKELLVTVEPKVSGDCAVPVASETEPPDEKRVADGIHFTKKTIKKILRGQMLDAELQAHADRLSLALDDYPGDDALPRGDIIQVARTYLSLAERLLQKKPG